MNVKKLKKGFTLIELLAVIAMIGVLSTVVFTSYTKYIRKSKVSAAETELMQMVNEIENLFLVNSAKVMPNDVELSPEYVVCYDDLETVGALQTYQYLSDNALSEDAVFTFSKNVFHLVSHGVDVYYDVSTGEFVEE